MTDTIQYGALPFVGYGQFVQTDAVAVMAFAIFHRRDLARARRSLTKARLALDAPATMRFDGQALFATETPVAETEAVRRVRTMVDCFNSIPGMVRYTYLRLEDHPEPLDDSEVGKAARAAIPDVLQKACFAVPEGGEHGPQAHECEVLRADTQNRNSHAHAVLLDLADMFAQALARALVTGSPGWIKSETDRITFWSNHEVTVRLDKRAPVPG